jgi:hypothetical protein
MLQPPSLKKLPPRHPSTQNENAFKAALDYMTEQMKQNATSSVVRDIYCFLNPCKDGPFYFFPDPTERLAAYRLWYHQVCTGCAWDHKPILRDLFGIDLDPDHPDSRYFVVPGTSVRMNYDVWSNIHYGYVGTAAGFSSQELQGAANSGLPGTGRTDLGDIISVQIGIDLYHRVGPRGLTTADVYAAIRSAIPAWVNANSGQILPN